MCKNCDTSNFATRFKCRDCTKPRHTGRAGSTANPPGKGKSKGKGKGGNPQVAAKPKKTEGTNEGTEAVQGKDVAKTDPWQTKEERRLKVSRLEKLLRLAEQNEHPDNESKRSRRS